jgi:UDP-glucose-4-epimerase GalE
VYGLPAEIPISEKASRLPISPYGTSKLAFEHALEAYGQAYGLRFARLRYFNAAGADESGEIGELHAPETHLIPRALEAASGLRGEFDVYGSEYPTPDGTCVRDYIHVNDLAEAHRLALNYLRDSEDSLTVNLGTGVGNSILEVLGAVEQVTGHGIRRRVCPPRAGDPPVLIADPRRAGQLLGWKSTRSLHEIVASAWKWMQSRNYAAVHKPA